jgi:phage repressor protein C with HTH and peptisase S24 domain
LQSGDIHKAQGRRLAAARLAAGYRSARAAALANGWPESTYRAHEAGTRTIGQDDAERYAGRFRSRGSPATARQILFGEGGEAARQAEPAARQIVPIMGYVGAGGDIDPDYEQVPFDGLEQVELPYAVDGDMIAFEVRGESMMPRYDDRAIVIVARDQPLAIDAMIGDDAVVRTHDGKRFLKRIMPGRRPSTFNLVSINAPTIEGARIAWASPVRMIIPNIGLRRRAAPKPKPASRSRRPRP